MNPPAHSRVYKMAKRQLARPPQKHSVAFCLVVSLFFPGIVDGIVSSRALGDLFRAGTTWSGVLTLSVSAAYYSAGMMLSAAYCAWLLKGYREIIEEQAKLLEEAPSKQCA